MFRWLVFLVAVGFGVGYVGIIMLVPPMSRLVEVYPDLWPQIGFYIHGFPGSVWLILGALQFFPGIRTNWPRLHRVSGYVALVSLIISVIGGVVIISSGKTEGGLTMILQGILFLIIWVLCVSGICHYFLLTSSNPLPGAPWLVLHAISIPH